jgi:DNA helicase II / ATP-dependent DNA helicase PcrA
MLEKPKPTDEQIAILDAYNQTGDNILINALAGGGKTSTLEMLPIKQNTLYLAFNKDVVEEAKDRLAGPVEIRTFNSMGNKCWKDGNGRANVNLKKIQEIFTAYTKDLKGKDKEAASEAYFDITAAVRMARHLGYIPEGKYPHARRLCDRQTLCERIERRLSPFELRVVDDILLICIQASYAGTIDLDDQVYMPALFGGSYPRFPNILVDENQDLSPVNHALLDKLVKGRITSVGDRWQSIYGFRGAETNGVDKTKGRFNMTEMPLSYSFRCPEAIVKAVHWHVPHMKWVKTGGTYAELSELDPDTIPDGAAIICRNNAPLYRAAFALLSRRRSVQVAGSDIGSKIIRLLGKVGNPRDSSEDLLFKIDGWLDEQLQTTNSPQTVEDTAECMRIFASWGKNLEQAIAYAKDLFARQGEIKLITGHKSKGREWDRVYHLDKHLLSKDDQDLNLKYVITTRAKQELYEIKSEDLQW